MKQVNSSKTCFSFINRGMNHKVLAPALNIRQFYEDIFSIFRGEMSSGFIGLERENIEEGSS